MYFILFIFLLIFFKFIDHLVGSYKDIRIVRNVMGTFTLEATKLNLQTRTLIPNVNDSFINQQISENYLREFKTDDFGIVKNPTSDRKYTGNSNIILFLGGSTTENNEVDAEYRFPYLVGEELNKKTPYQFIGVNAGVRGNTSQDSLNLLLNHPSPYFHKANYVAMMHNINDRLRLYLHDDYKAQLQANKDNSFNLFKKAVWDLTYSVVNFIEQNSNIGYLAVNTINDAINSGQIKINEDLIDAEVYLIGDEKLNIIRQNFINFIHLVNANRQTPILITQPLYKRSYAQDQVNDLIRSVALEFDVLLIDLANAIKNLEHNGGPLFYHDGIHFNNLGSKFAAEYISQTLIESKNWLPNQSTSLNECNLFSSHRLSFDDKKINQNILNGRYPNLNVANNKLLFQTNNEKGSSISLLNKDGSIEILFKHSDPNLIEHPMWVNDREIIFIQNKNYDRKIYRLNLDNNSIDLLELGDISLFTGIPSVYKNKIYFAGYKNRKSPHIFEYNLINKELHQITNNPGEDWRPIFDGDKIYYINNQIGDYRLYSVNPDGTENEQMMTKEGSIHWDPQTKEGNDFIFYAEKKDGSSFDLIKLNKMTKNKTQLTDSIFNIWDPSISNDGKYLFFATESVYGDQIRCMSMH